MAVEAKRGCGYRKVGGLYLRSGKLADPCHKLPVPLTVCPTCSCGVKPARGWTWVKREILGEPCPTGVNNPRTGRLSAHCALCPICSPPNTRLGLLWIGEGYYPTPEAFMREAARAGVSRRIKCLPKGFEPGKTVVLMAHRKAIRIDEQVAGRVARGTKSIDDVEIVDESGELAEKWQAGIVTAFVPTAVELILRKSEATAERVAEEAERGVTVVAVPDGDPDHDPSGPSQQEELFEEGAVS